MTSTMNYTTTLIVQECCNCHVLFGIPKYWDDSLRETHATFYCPAGHGQSYTGKTEAEKLREKLDFTNRNLGYTQAALTSANDQLGATRRSLAAQKGITTKIKNRVAAGVCPCCNRQFQNLHRHMAGQHPDFPTPATKE